MKAVNEPTQLMLMNLQEQTRRRHHNGENSPFKTALKLMKAIGEAVPDEAALGMITAGIAAWVEKLITGTVTEVLDEVKKMSAARQAAAKKAGREVPEVALFIETVMTTWYSTLDIPAIAESLVEEFITNADTPIAPNMELGKPEPDAAPDPTAVPGDVVAQLLRKMVDPSAN